MISDSQNSSVPDSLRWDDEHDEPYLRVPGHDNIRLTPYRPGDDEEVVKMNNDPVVGKWAFRRPYPYLPEDMGFVWEVIYPACKATGEKLKPLLQGREWSASINESAISSTGERSLPFQTVPGFPFSVLRDVTTGRVIGTFSMFTYVPLVSKSDPKPATTTAPVDAAAAAKDMFAGKGQESVAPGDQVWEMAYDLAESARGKGYSVPAVKSAIDNWARWVGIGTVRAQVETSNLASQAVVRKAGLQYVGSRHQEWPVEKGGGQREIGTWEIKLQ